MKKKTKFETVIITGKYGINDLKSEFAWVGSLQGDTSVSNDAAKEMPYMHFVFDGIDRTDQKAILKEVYKRRQWNRNYIWELKRDSLYGKEYYTDVITIHHSLFDNEKSGKPSQSNKTVILNAKTGEIEEILPK